MALACFISPANRKRGKQVPTNRRPQLIGPTFAPDLNGRNSVEPAVNGIAAILSNLLPPCPVLFKMDENIFRVLRLQVYLKMGEKSTYR